MKEEEKRFENSLDEERYRDLFLAMMDHEEDTFAKKKARDKQEHKGEAFHNVGFQYEKSDENNVLDKVEGSDVSTKSIYRPPFPVPDGIDLVCSCQWFLFMLTFF